MCNQTRIINIATRSQIIKCIVVLLIQCPDININKVFLSFDVFILSLFLFYIFRNVSPEPVCRFHFTHTGFFIVLVFTLMELPYTYIHMHNKRVFMYSDKLDEICRCAKAIHKLPHWNFCHVCLFFYSMRQQHFFHFTFWFNSICVTHFYQWIHHFKKKCNRTSFDAHVFRFFSVFYFHCDRWFFAVTKIIFDNVFSPPSYHSNCSNEPQSNEHNSFYPIPFSEHTFFFYIGI